MSWHSVGAWLGGWLGRVSAALTGQHVDITEAVAGCLSSHGSWMAVVETRIPLRRTVWPYLMVYADFDRSHRVTIIDPSPYDRVATIAVVGMIKMQVDTIAIEDKMDSIADEIESWLTTTRMRIVIPGLQSLSLVHTGTEVFESHAEVTTLWNIAYANEEGIPGILI